MLHDSVINFSSDPKHGQAIIHGWIYVDKIRFFEGLADRLVYRATEVISKIQQGLEEYPFYRNSRITVQNSPEAIVLLSNYLKKILYTIFRLNINELILKERL